MSAGWPPVNRTSSSKVVGNTACGIPPAAHTCGNRANAVSTTVRSARHDQRGFALGAGEDEEIGDGADLDADQCGGRGGLGQDLDPTGRGRGGQHGVDGLAIGMHGEQPT